MRVRRGKKNHKGACRFEQTSTYTKHGNMYSVGSCTRPGCTVQETVKMEGYGK